MNHYKKGAPINTLEIFNRDKELRAWWIQVTTHQNFERVQMYARSAFLDLQPTQEQLRGAKMLEELQMGLAQLPDEINQLPSPGLHHSVEALPLRTKRKRK